MTGSNEQTEVGEAAASDSALRLELPTLVLAPGDTVGRYRVLQRVGAGGMGIVYAAHDPELDRRVALKLLHPRRAAHSTKGHARLLREAQAMARLRHPNVVTVHHVGTIERGGGSFVYVAMEFVDGVTLDDWLRARSRDWPEIVRVFVEAGRGLAAAHASGLVHRDFKPENVLVARDPHERVVVTDFGLAREVDPSGTSEHDGVERVFQDHRRPRLDRTEAGAGTLSYMAPEQHLRVTVDARADQFAFAVALYEALWRKHPFSRDSPEATIVAVTRGEVREPPVRSSVPARVRDAVMRGLLPDPARRFPTMDAMIDALQSSPSDRRRWIAGATFGVAALGLAAAVAVPRATATPCSDANEQLADVWNPDRAERVTAALRAIDAPFAAETAAQVAPRLEAYAAAWTAAWTQTCAAAAEAGAPTREIDARMICLARRKMSLQTAVDVLVEADVEVLSRALQTVASLPAVEQCNEPDAMALPVPTDPELVEPVAAVRRMIADLEMRHSVVGSDVAIQLAEAAVAAAGQTGWDPVIAETLLARSSVRDKAGVPADAAEDATAAYYAAEAADDAGLALGAAVALVRLHGLRLQDTDRAEQWIRHARAWLARTEYPERGETKLRIAIGWTRYAQGRFDEAAIELRTALERTEQADGPDHYRVAECATAFGAVQFELGQYDAALALQERALQIVERQFGAHNPAVADALTNIGGLLLFLGRTDEAIAALQRGLALREASGDPSHPGIALLANNLADALASSDRCPEALPHFTRARAILESRLGAEHPDAITVLANEANCLVVTGRADEGIAALRHALELRERTIGADHPDVAENRRALADALREQGQLAEARELVESGLAAMERTQGGDHPRIASFLADLARLELAEHRPREAAKLLRRALPLAERSLGPEHAETKRIAGLLAEATR